MSNTCCGDPKPAYEPFVGWECQTCSTPWEPVFCQERHVVDFSNFRDRLADRFSREDVETIRYAWKQTMRDGVVAF